MLNKIVCMVALDKTILTIDNNIIIQPSDKSNNYNEYNNGIYFVILSLNDYTNDYTNNYQLTNINFFDTIRLYDIKYMQSYVNSINELDIFIILSKGYPFNIYSNLGIFKMLGSKIEKYTNKSNYLFIGSKKYGTFYEFMSENPVIYPQINILESKCKILPTEPNAKPLEHNLFYSNQVPNDEKINRCALESLLWNYKSFGIANNRCIPISDKEFNSIKKLNNSDKCIDGISGNSISGNSINGSDRFTISMYKFNTSIKLSNKYGIRLFSEQNYKGFMTLLNEGDYNTIDIDLNFKSIIVPKNYNVFITYKNSANSIFGPKKINILNDNIENISIKFIKENSVTFCDKDNYCFVLDPGKHVLDPSLYITITDVKMSDKTKKVILYKDIGFSNVVQSFDKSGKVLYPVIIRALQIL